MMHLIDWAARVMDVVFDITVPVACAVGLWEMGELWLSHAREQNMAELQRLLEEEQRRQRRHTGEGTV